MSTTAPDVLAPEGRRIRRPSGARTGLQPALVDSWVLSGRRTLLLRRRPASLFGAIVMPIVFTLLFFTVFERVMDRLGIDYAQFLVPAVVVQAMFFAGMTAAVVAAEDASGGMLTRLRAMPVSRSAPFVGLLAAQSLRAAISLAVLLPFGMALGFRFEGGPLGAVSFVAMALAFVLTVCAGYLALGLAVGRPDVVHPLTMLPYFPLLLLSNAFTPADRFPGWLQPIVRNQPVSQVADALRALAADGPPTGRAALEAVAWLVPLFAGFAVLAARGFGRTR